MRIKQPSAFKQLGCFVYEFSYWNLFQSAEIATCSAIMAVMGVPYTWLEKQLGADHSNWGLSQSSAE